MPPSLVPARVIENTLSRNPNDIVRDFSSKKWSLRTTVANQSFMFQEFSLPFENHKQRTETILKAITASLPNVEVVTTLVKNTTVKVDGKKAFSIYYRKNEIRADVPLDSKFFNLGKELESKGIAYQKESADPYATSGVYSFFVADENELYAYRFLLGCLETGNIVSESFTGKRITGLAIFGKEYDVSSFADMVRICMKEIYNRNQTIIHELANSNYKMTQTEKIFITKDISHIAELLNKFQAAIYIMI